MFCAISFTLEASSCAILVVSVGSTRHSCTNTIASARRRNCWVMKRFFVHQTMLMTDFSVHFLRCYSSVVDDVLGIKNFQLKSTNSSWIPSLPMPNDNGLTIFETNNTRFYDPSYLFSLFLIVICINFRLMKIKQSTVKWAWALSRGRELLCVQFQRTWRTVMRRLICVNIIRSSCIICHRE